MEVVLCDREIVWCPYTILCKGVAPRLRLAREHQAWGRGSPRSLGETIAACSGAGAGVRSTAQGSGLQGLGVPWRGKTPSNMNYRGDELMHREPRLSVISLFTGAGGLDLGLEAAGFTTKLCVEVDEDARATLRANRPHWKLADPGDIHKFDPLDIVSLAGFRRREVLLLVGGPPCQPFSKSGYWAYGDSARLNDPRADTLNAYLKVVEAALPQVLLFENVKGLGFRGKDEGLQLLHREIEAINRKKRTRYTLQELHINAADYGVPQIRERIFLLADRDGRAIKLPSPTHGLCPTDDLNRARIKEPYRTAWDAIGDLDTPDWGEELIPKGRWAGLLPSIPEGNNYLWHTERCGGLPLFGWRTRYWSFLLKLAKNRPSWTLQAEAGPATGPFHWRSRLLSTRELCRLQTFPDDHKIVGSRPSAKRQVGNAVPPAVGELLGIEIRRQLLGHQLDERLRLIPKRRPDCPPAEPLRPVPRRYFSLVGKHAEHPGVGKGPRARRRPVV
jgi:DNA (cytosine-5)-methyltransferase 1